MFQIGDITTPNCIGTYGLTVKAFGVDLVPVEMISGKCIINKNEKTMNLLYIDEEEMPMSLQIFGGDKETFVEAVQFVD